MTSSDNLDALASDVLALQAVVRALARLQARRSPAALNDLMQALCEETGRLAETAPFYDERARRQAISASSVVGAWIQELREEAQAA